jgi:type IV secretion system protein VirB10
MTTQGPGDPRGPEPGAKPEGLELRGRQAPVTRINRKVLIGGAAVLLLLISLVVLAALRPPSLRIGGSLELYNVDHKPITEALTKLPATYDGVRPDRPAVPVVAKQDPLVPQLKADTVDPAAEAARAEQARLRRLAADARQAPLFFRQQPKSPPRDTPKAEPHTEPHVTSPATKSADGDLSILTALRAADRARALGAGDLDLGGTEPSDQLRKLSFLKAGPEKDIYNPHALQTPASPYQLMAGTVIAASLVTGLNSDLPGFVIAQVTENVFDTVSGRFLLIPQGSRLVGKYDNVVAFGQERALVVWQRIIRPDGSSIVIDNLPATDTGGYAGLADQVDLHTWKLLKGVALATVLGVGSALAFGSADNDLIRALQLSTQSTTNRAGQRLVERNLNVQPTITVRPGWPLRVIAHKDIVFLRPYRSTASQ